MSGGPRGRGRGRTCLLEAGDVVCATRPEGGLRVCVLLPAHGRGLGLGEVGVGGGGVLVRDGGGEEVWGHGWLWEGKVDGSVEDEGVKGLHWADKKQKWWRLRTRGGGHGGSTTRFGW